MPSQLQLFEARDAQQSWQVRVSVRARRLSVRVYPGGRVEVVVPPGASAATVHKFVRTHRDWIAQRVSDLSTASRASDDRRPSAIDLPAVERFYRLSYERTPSNTVRIEEVRPGELVLGGRTDDDGKVAEALREWLAALAQQELSSKLAALATLGGFQFQRVQIRRQRTRWGSCSAKGTISLNLCLMFLDPAVVRYLLVHELCHTRHMNHSPRFWALVEANEPDYERLDRDLLKGWQCVPGWVFG